MQLIEEIFNEFSLQPPKVYHNSAEELAFSIESLQGAVPSTLKSSCLAQLQNLYCDKASADGRFQKCGFLQKGMFCLNAEKQENC